MLRSRLFWRLFLAYLAILAVVGGGTGPWMLRQARAQQRAAAEASLQSSAALLGRVAREALAAPEPVREAAEEALRAELAAADSRGAVRLTVIAADGRVVADTRKDWRLLDHHGDRPEVQLARREGRGISERFSATLAERFVYVALPVRAGPPGDGAAQPGGALVGFVRAAMPARAVAARERELALGLAWGLVAAVLLGGAACAWFTARVRRAVGTFEQAAREVADGRYPPRLQLRESEELARAGEALDAMAARLSERLETITSDRNKVLAILASMVEGVIAVDREERVMHMNEVAGRLLRVPPERAVGRRIWELTRQVEVCEILDQTRRDAVEKTREVRFSSAGGGGGPAAGKLIDLRASPLRDGSGALAGAVVVLHDVTELRRLEGVRRDFVANVSHELKTPLTAIRGLIETLLDDAAMPDDTRRRFLEKIRDQAGRLSTLVSDLLTLARVETQEAQLERRLLDLRAPLRECAARFLPLCQRKAIQLELQLPEQAVEVRGDEEALRQIVDNLLDNAVKYTPQGGRVWLRLARRAETGEAEIEVRDTGIGIEPRDQERVFERFYRVDKARSRELGGTGLGLSIVKHLCLSMDGRVGIESTPGKGSAFRVHLPLAA